MDLRHSLEGVGNDNQTKEGKITLIELEVPSTRLVKLLMTNGLNIGACGANIEWTRVNVRLIWSQHRTAWTRVNVKLICSKEYSHIF